MIPPALSDLLEQHRAALEALPGVIGTAVGLSADQPGGELPAIHVYVTPAADAARVRAEAERLLGDAPVEVIEMEMPEAQPR
jgi:hypothetical protein